MLPGLEAITVSLCAPDAAADAAVIHLHRRQLPTIFTQLMQRSRA